MTFASVFEFTRVLAAFLLVFLAVPLIGNGQMGWRRQSPGRKPALWIAVVLRAFVRASFAAEVACLLLGRATLCLPGLMLSGCLVCLMRGLWIANKRRSDLIGDGSRTFWQAWVAFRKGKRSPEARLRIGTVLSKFKSLSPASKLFLACIALVLLIEARVPLQQLHFDHADTYTRTVSLAALTQGQAWKVNGSVAFLAPLVSISGLNAISVIRFTGPILASVFALLIALCMWRVWHSWVAALTALLLFVWFSLSPAKTNWELLPGSIAIIYAVAAGAIWPHSRKDGLMAAATGFMIAPGEWIPAIACGLLVLSVLFSAWARPRLRMWVAAPLATSVLLGVVLVWLAQKPPFRAVQYESAARVSTTIGDEFHRNEWLVVSPFQELAFTYGQGWHSELSEFVLKFTPPQVSSPTFSFPYDSPHVFFFVERRPLLAGSPSLERKAIWRYAPAESRDPSAFLYGDPQGRASLEFRAAELLNAYAQSHRNLSIFYEDDDLVVYHLGQASNGS
ncbi:MAG: hypothetical protein ACR2IV_11330 [Bryobacteraceae bacterium]